MNEETVFGAPYTCPHCGKTARGQCTCIADKYVESAENYVESKNPNKARKHTSPILQELLNEITPEEMEKTRKEMNSLTVAAFRDWWEQAIGLNSAAKQDCFCTCRDEITKLLNNEKQNTNC